MIHILELPAYPKTERKNSRPFDQTALFLTAWLLFILSLITIIHEIFQFLMKISQIFISFFQIDCLFKASVRDINTFFFI